MGQQSIPLISRLLSRIDKSWIPEPAVAAVAVAVSAAAAAATAAGQFLWNIAFAVSGFQVIPICIYEG